ncbi:glycine cleavage system protein R [Salinispirillum marinum]|uniref:Glycine cleavage system transcriptional repressor n=2 Tax=Saccharospirillaceae TaxID=255527 RepID=A0ABV8BCF3_9GAMM
MTPMLLTIIADDRPGIVEAVADVISTHQGNWLESQLANLAGKFAGIVRIELPEDQVTALSTALAELHSKGIKVSIDEGNQRVQGGQARVKITVTGSDRPGIVREITALLARQQVNVLSMNTQCELAPMSNDHLFVATVQVVLPDSMDEHDLAETLEGISTDLMVDTDVLAKL